MGPSTLSWAHTSALVSADCMVAGGATTRGTFEHSGRLQKQFSKIHGKPSTVSRNFEREPLEHIDHRPRHNFAGATHKAPRI